MDPGKSDATQQQPAKPGLPDQEKADVLNAAFHGPNGIKDQDVTVPVQTKQEKISYSKILQRPTINSPNSTEPSSDTRSPVQPAKAKIQQANLYLHIPNININKAQIILENCPNKPVDLKLMQKTDNGDVWCMKNVTISTGYHYRISIKGVESPGSSPINDNIDWITEAKSRSLKFDVLYDTFHSPDDKDYARRTRSESCIFYAKKLLQKVTHMENSMKRILEQLEGSLLFLSSSEVAKEAATWFINAIGPSLGECRLFYIAIILGFLVTKHPESITLDSNMETTSKVDYLLQSLLNFRFVTLLTPLSIGTLEKLAPILVKASSKPGWLTMAVHFSPYTGVRWVVTKQIFSKQTCDENEYMKLVHNLLEFLASSPNKETKTLVDRLLSMVLSTAPNALAVFTMYNSPTFEKYCTASGIGKDDFFVMVCETWHHNDDIDISQKMVELTKIPTQVRGDNLKISKIVQAVLLKFLKKKEKKVEPTKEHVVALVKLMLFQSEDKVIEALEELSSSKFPFIHNLLIMILNNEDFSQKWKMLNHDDRVDICSEWIAMRLKKNKQNKENRAVNTFEHVNQLMKCTLNIEDSSCLLEKLCENLANRLLHSLEPPSIIKAHNLVENYTENTKKMYLDLLEHSLRKFPKLAPQAIHQLIHAKLASSNSSSSAILSNFEQELLLCALDIMDIPKDDFKEMLAHSDLWRILLNASGQVKKLKNHPKFKQGKQNWKSFSSSVKDRDISFKILSEISEKQQKDVSFIFAKVNLGPSAPASELDKERIMYEECISELLRVERDSVKQLDLLESLIKFIKAVSEDTQWEPDPLEELNRQRQRNQNVSEYKDESFWGKFLPLLGPARKLEPFMKSMSFLTLAKAHMKELYSRQPDIRELAIGLATKVKKRFHSKWTTVLCEPSAITVNEIDILLGDLNIDKQLEEFALLKDLFLSLFTPDLDRYLKGYVEFPTLLGQVRCTITMLDTFGITDERDNAFSTLIRFVKMYGDCKNVTLQTLDEAMVNVEKIVSGFMKGHNEGVITELGNSTRLISFVKEIVDEDIGFLTDAVEEHSDQFVKVSLVSELFDVHRFIGVLIKCVQKKAKAEKFLDTLKEACKYDTKMAAKLQQCNTHVNSLRGLYSSVANRGEITKEIITNCLKKGSYLFGKNENDVYTVTMKYKREGKENDDASYKLSELHELRSRAHLIITSAEKNAKDSTVKENSEDIDFSVLILQVNLSTEILSLLSKLQFSGFRIYRNYWKQIQGTQALQDTRDTLQKDLETWESILLSARQKYYFLNYYRSEQLCILHDFLASVSKNDGKEVLSLVQFVDPNITMNQLTHYQKMYTLIKSSDNPTKMISDLGNVLGKIFAKARPAKRPIRSDRPHMRSSSRNVNATVKPGELFVASLEEASLLTANVMVTLYENTSHAFPEPNQVVFCGPETSWEEIYLLLQRCFSETKHLKRDSLFCIANVELLSNENQFELISAIKEKQNDEDILKDDEDYRLALICRGGDHHHFVEEFSKYSHHISGMSDYALTKCLKSSWPEVKIVTSTLPGLGKTESIRNEVLKKKMNIVTFPISGPLHERNLIRRLKKLDLKKYHCLHLDIGEIDNPLWLDMFLFQLIITGMVSSGTQFYHLETEHLYIEIANTLKDRLRESLTILKYFIRNHLGWSNFDNLLATSEVTSNLQVVCRYFDAYDRADLESTDISFSDSEKIKPLSAKRCGELLDRYYSHDTTDMSFTVLNTFLAVLADQLLKFSSSDFFKIANLKAMIGKEAQGVRTKLFTALVEVSKDFTARSITCQTKELQVRSPKDFAEALDKVSKDMTAKDMVERVEKMIRWENSNHLLIVFQGVNSQSIAAVYRDKKLVDTNIANFLKSQVVKGNKKDLDDFQTMNQQQLQEKLEKIVCTKSSKDVAQSQFSDYVLTPDNVLKMILIIMRVRANVPVIIMGETGCGKTSLVKYLANVHQSKFSLLGFHAGITEDEIKEFVLKKQLEAKESNGQVWVFLDEINTCDHLGLINDLMCHRTFFGRPLCKNLVFIAACNPYELRPKDQITTAGLEGKNVKDEYSELVYRVHALPEAMIDYVWDYGSLAQNDEKVYVERMVENMPSQFKGVFVKLLIQSQQFIRKVENNRFCVSLRDVYRCIRLAKWFMKNTLFKKKNEVPRDSLDYLTKYRSVSEKYKERPITRSIILALAHCYQSRLPTDDLRRKYRKLMITLFSNAGTIIETKREIDDFEAIVRMEEEDYLGRMELPPGTAKNAALRENVFVMLVSILNQIPLFVVGKPGCSKSLSIQLIRSNLRGQDSKDPLFQELPQLYVISYQGSESSTSEGIIKIFDKAKEYKKHNKDKKILPVVLLDEVGLAENSKNNPLKVLHGLLEPADGQLPEVAVIGISNWALDAAKMNRAIHLSRPEPTIDDLFETGQSLIQEDGKKVTSDKELRCLAEAYSEYQKKQRYPNFHGLRDYYSLTKSLNNGADTEKINIALQRNFGGIPGEVSKIQQIFLSKLSEEDTSAQDKFDIVPVTQLVLENLDDPLARHLMLITSGDSAVGILKQSLNQRNESKEIITIFGSCMEEDMSEDYNYRILSRIILCMEGDCILILRDLERIYGSLYDMLNQNYAVVGKRKNCRVALGAYSNPMCNVNDGFRCIVLIDQDKIDISDPPFLNRFEKQLLRFCDVLSNEKCEIMKELEIWVKKMSTVQGYETHFKKSDLFVGYHENTLPSLVLLHFDEDDPKEDVIQKCKEELMWIATPDGVLRTQKCQVFQETPAEIDLLCDRYFEKALHDGFASFVDTVIINQGMGLTDDIGSKTIIMTYSTIRTDIPKCLAGKVSCQTERLSAYKSEKQLSEKINTFWSASQHEMLVLQCKPELDAEHMVLARSIIEEKRNSYAKSCQDRDNLKQKHVCIIVHLQRGKENIVPWHFSFLCGWKQVFLDVLEVPSIPLNEIRTQSIPDLLTSGIWPLKKIVQNNLLWCFTCIKYTKQQRSPESILHLTKNLFKSDEIYRAVERLILKWLEDDLEVSEKRESWQVTIACNKESLINSSTLSFAMEQHVFRLLREPLAKLIYFIEKENAWPPHLLDISGNESLETEHENMWCDLIQKNVFLNMSLILKPQGVGSYTFDGTTLNLHLPFSQVIFTRIEVVKDIILQNQAQLNENENNFDDSRKLKSSVESKLLEHYAEIIVNCVPDIREFPVNCCHSYAADLFDVVSKDFRQTMTRNQRVSLIRSAFLSYLRQSAKPNGLLQFYAKLHLFVWTSKEQIISELQFVDYCQQFVRPEVMKSLTDQFLSSDDMRPFLEDIDKTRYDNMNEESLDDFEQIERFGDLHNDDDDFPESDLRQQDDVDKINNNEVSDEVEDEISKSDESGDDQQNEEENKQEEIQSEEDEFQNEREDEDEMEMEPEEEQNFEEFLVTIISEEMLPSEDAVEMQNGSVEDWIRNTSLMLSLAYKINTEAPAFHYLRLCVDFAKIVALQTTPTNQPCYSLYILNEIAERIKPDYLDNEESFKSITEYLIKPLEQQLEDEPKKREVLQKFSALFYGRCLDTNVDNTAALSIIDHVLSLNDGGLVLIMSPVILRLLMVEQMVTPDVFISIVSNDSEIEDHSCLQNIDEVFKDLFAQGQIHHDSYAAVMICDMIQSLLNFELRYNVKDLDSSDCELLCLVRRAIDVLYEDEEDSSGLLLLSSISFLRAFFTMLSNAIASDPNKLTSDTIFSRIMDEINSLLKINNILLCRQSSLRLFFLKQLRQDGMRLFDIRKLCHEGKCIDAMKDVFMEQSSGAKADFVFVGEIPEYDQAKAAYLKITKGDEKEMLDFLDKCQHSANHVLSLMRILANKIYIKRAEQKLTDKEEQLAQLFSDKIRFFKTPAKEVILRILGRKDFDHQLMQLSPESSVKDAEIAMLVLHISCVLTSPPQKENSPLKLYFSDPLKCKQTFILAEGKNRVYKVFDKRGSAEAPLPVSCACGLRIMFKDKQVQNKCPRCKTQTFAKSEPIESTGFSTTAGILDWDARTKEMSPSEFRALHLIVYASLYAGVAMGISSKLDLSSLVKLTDCMSEDAAMFSLNQIKADLKCLATILCCNEETAINVMHIVIEKCTKLFRGESQAGNTCSTSEQRQKWEAEFSSIAKEVLTGAFGSGKALKDMMKQQKTSTINQVYEVDSYPGTPKEQNQELKRLFRTTRKPSFEGFQSTFANKSIEFQENHSFLSLFFAKFHELSNIGYLYDLLQWTRLISSALTHRISRKDAKSKTINDFITGHLLDQPKNEDEKRSYQVLFNKFKEAWSKVRDLVNQVRQNQKGKDMMPRLKETDPIGYCLIESDSGIHLHNAIKVLVSLQNSILDEMIFLSATQQQPSLRFLEKSNECSGTACVSTQDAKEKEIVKFCWSDEFFKYAKNNPEYGQGEEVYYDFELMEIELANEIGLGKCYLVEALNKFIFSNELFHSVGPMLTEIRKLLGNSNLPDEIRRGLYSIKDRRIQDAQNLLQHIEVVISFINQGGVVISGEMTLEKYVEVWTTKSFPLSLLPEPKSSIKMEHIPALYEALEDLLADGAIEGLPETLRQDLAVEVKEQLEQIVNNKQGDLKLQAYINALRRFVFRYLSSEKFRPKDNPSLSCCLKEPSLWSPGTPPNLGVVLKDITLEHIYSLIMYLQELDQKQRNSRRPHAFRGNLTTPKQPGKKRRGIIAKFSRS